MKILFSREKCRCNRRASEREEQKFFSLLRGGEFNIGYSLSLAWMLFTGTLIDDESSETTARASLISPYLDQCAHR